MKAKSKLKWRLKEVGFDPENHGQIARVLHEFKIYDLALSFSHEEVATLHYSQIMEGWPADDWPEISSIDEHAADLKALAANPQKRRRYEDLGGFVNGEWRWFTQPPVRQKSRLNQRSREILRHIAAHRPGSYLSKKLVLIAESWPTTKELEEVCQIVLHEGTV
jgi:hypothetical protein